MTISKISLEWFRGAAQRTELNTENKSVVIYGPNGSGKSSFIDAIEYLIDGHRVGHLRHEYSGRNQEKALLNTNTPFGQSSLIELEFDDGATKKVQIDNTGTVNYESSCTDDPSSWDYRRTVLRQDEVAAFVNDSKANKYSTLLPLLGLGELETTAENTRLLTLKFTSESRIKENKAILTQLDLKTKQWGTRIDVLKKCSHLISQYGGATTPISEITKLSVTTLTEKIQGQINSLGIESKKHLLVTQIATVDIKTHVETIRSANSVLASSSETLIMERVSVLAGAADFIAGHHHSENIQCPACGQDVATEAFREHVEGERSRLETLTEAFEKRSTAIQELNQALRRLQEYVSAYDGLTSQDKLLTEDQHQTLKLRSARTQKDYTEEDLVDIETNFDKAIVWAVDVSKELPPDSADLAANLRLAELSAEILEGLSTHTAVLEAQAVLDVLSSLEREIRDSIKERASAVIDSISADIQRMWAILHPQSQIEGITLFVPNTADKAIDIHLKFYGVDQDSPRLTLSEGYRNSLGLCIFLAMVKFEGNKNRPLFLDDVVVSLDRDHRGMIRDLLTSEFNGFQVVLLTHDREWFGELRMLMNGPSWSFKMLMPFDGPENGIRFSESGNFEGARALLDSRPDSAGNDARKIMDVELPMIAEKLELTFPFVRGHKNDQRLSHEILEKLISVGKKCLQITDGTNPVPNEDVLEKFKEADKLLIAWGNKASHTFDIVKAEATILIDACEVAMDTFTCLNCKKKLWAVGDSKSRQCKCGRITWRTDKDS